MKHSVIPNLFADILLGYCNNYSTQMKHLKFQKTITVLTVLLVTFMSSSDCFAQNNDRNFDLQIIVVPFDMLKPTCEKFEAKYPDIEYRVMYFAPNFVLRAGPCGIKKSVEELQKTLLNDYPNSTITECQSDQLNDVKLK